MDYTSWDGFHFHYTRFGDELQEGFMKSEERKEKSEEWRWKSAEADFKKGTVVQLDKTCSFTTARFF